MKRLAILFAGLAICGTAAAQGFNPVVEVTNAYKGKLMEVHKQEVQMAVPDTMLRFDYDFDYTTFENPYKGAYDFSPYKMNMTPEPRAFDGRNLFVKAGAGYSLNPEARIVWAPKLKGKAGDKLSLTFEDDFNGYWGQYHELKSVNRDSWSVLKKSNVYNNGHDAANQLRMGAAINASKALVTAVFDWNLVNSAYDGTTHLSQALVNTVPRYGNSLNSLGGTLGVQSKGHGSTFAEFNLGYRYGDGISTFTVERRNDLIFEHNVKAQSRVGKRLSRPGMMAFIDIDVENENFHMLQNAWSSDSRANGIARTNLFMLSVTPTLAGHNDRLNYSAGLKISMTTRSSSPDSLVTSVGNGHIFYPQVHVDYALVKDALKVYANFGGGDRIESYSSLVNRYHFLNLTPVDGMEHVVDVYDFNAGLSGRAHARFQYEIEGGLGRTDNAVCESIGTSWLMLVKDYVRANVFSAYAKASGAWTSEAFDVKANFMFRNSDALDDTPMLLPSRFTGGFSATWNWRQRIYLGATMDAASYRRMVNVPDWNLPLWSEFNPYDTPAAQIPGYIDLGVNAEYRASSKMSVWAKGGNLLGNAIQREAMFARRGAFFTLGLSVNL